MDPYHTEEYRGYSIRIEYDQDPSNPRTEWDNAATMACFHPRYTLGDEGYELPDLDGMHQWAEETHPKWYASGENTQRFYTMTCRTDQEVFERYMDEMRDKAEVLPLFLYNHGGITMSTGSFSCRWDSGQVGWIFITREQMRETFNVKTITKKVRERARELMEHEVKIYDHYLTGQVFGYVVGDDEDDHLESCWGFYGHEDADGPCLEEAKRIVDWYVQKKEEAAAAERRAALQEHMTKLKAYIRNNVPLPARRPLSLPC